MLSALPWTSTFDSRPVLTCTYVVSLHCWNRCPTIRFLCSHSTSSPMPATQQGWGQKTWAATASQLPSLSMGCDVCAGPCMRSRRGHPQWAPHTVDPWLISPLKPGTLVLPCISALPAIVTTFWPPSYNHGIYVESKLKKLEKNRISYWRSFTATLICNTQLKIRKKNLNISLSGPITWTQAMWKLKIFPDVLQARTKSPSGWPMGYSWLCTSSACTVEYPWDLTSSHSSHTTAEAALWLSQR